MSFRASDIEIVASGLVPKDRIILTTQQSKQFLTTLCRAITEQLRGEGARLRRVLENQELVHISNIRWPRKSSLFTREPKALVDFVTLLTRRGEQLQQVSARAAREWEEVLLSELQQWRRWLASLGVRQKKEWLGCSMCALLTITRRHRRPLCSRCLTGQIGPLDESFEKFKRGREGLFGQN